MIFIHSHHVKSKIFKYHEYWLYQTMQTEMIVIKCKCDLNYQWMPFTIFYFLFLSFNGPIKDFVHLIFYQPLKRTHDILNDIFKFSILSPIASYKEPLYQENIIDLIKFLFAKIYFDIHKELRHLDIMKNISIRLSLVMIRRCI